MNADTRQLRRSINAKRLAQPAESIAESSLAICKTLCRMQPVRRAESIAIYLADFGEVDCGAFMGQMIARKKSIYAPILRKNRLLFAPLRPNTPLQANRFGIAEPVYTTSELRTPSQLDVVITPLVAFDAQLNRLGMGGGYYDRSFAFKKHRQHWRRPLMIGVGYSFQHVLALRPQAWDVPLDVAVTEKESYGSY